MELYKKHILRKKGRIDPDKPKKTSKHFDLMCYSRSRQAEERERARKKLKKNNKKQMPLVYINNDHKE